LPWEKQLIDTLGLTLEEYQWYVNQVANYRPERDAAYDIVPHVVCDPVTVSIVTTVVGAGLSFAASALAPKPKLPKRSDPAQQQSGSDVTGASVNAENRFTNVDGFTSVQPLAKLGEIMPLVFANRRLGLGGVRVETKLLWSQLLSQGDGQELVVVLLAGAGVLDQIPNIKGFAIGDSLMQGYQTSKFAIYFKRGVPGEKRLNTLNRIAGDLKERGIDAFGTNFSNEGMKPLFSGVRIPTTMTQFGAYQPLRNGQSYRLPFKRVRVSFPPFVSPGSGGDIAGALREWEKAQEAATKADIERNKIESFYACRTGIITVNGQAHDLSAGGFQDVDVEVGTNFQFHILEGNVTNIFNDFGAQDIAAKDDNYRLSCDEVLSIGETYLVGDVEAVCIAASPSDAPFTPAATKVYVFKALTAGKVRRVASAIAGHGPDFRANNLGGRTNPCTGSTISKLAVAHITTTRKVDQIEIGIRSQVYKQFTGFANFACMPPEGTLNAIEAGGNTFNIGQYSDYGLRYSFFEVLIRERGTEQYTSLNHDGRPFAVQGRTPVDQFNFIRIRLPKNDVQYEIRLRPIAGAMMFTKYAARVCVLDVRGTFNIPVGLQSYVVGASNGLYTISYRGYPENITQLKGTNGVMFRGGAPSNGGVASFGAVDYKTNGPLAETIFNTTTIVGTGSGLTVKVSVEELSSEGTLTAFATSSSPSFGMKWLHTDVLKAGNPTGEGQRFQGRVTYSYVKPDGNFDYTMEIEVLLDLVSAQTSTFGVSQGYTLGGYMWICSAVPSARITLTGNISQAVMNQGQYALQKPPNSAIPPNGIQRSVLDLFTDQSSVFIAYIVPANPGSNYGTSSRIRIDGAPISLPNVTVQEIITFAQTETVFETYDAVADVYLYDQQEGSHQTGPEHQVVYINEQRYNEITPQYDNMALIGLQLRSGKEWNDFTNFSYYAKQGCQVSQMIDVASGSTSGYGAPGSQIGPTNLFPEILRHLLRAPSSGAGTLIPDKMIDWAGFQEACKVCVANKLFYDGVIGSPVNVRDWAYEHASYFFLDFLILGGKISLQPTFPVNPSEGITGYSLYGAYDRLPKISALFTDGNIIEDSLQVSWYPSEQRIAPQVLVTVRDEVEDGFAETRNILVRPNDANYKSLQVEAVDFTGFCTSAAHAVDFAKLLIQTRRFVTHTVTFRTFPEGLVLAPGAYFKLSSQARHTDRFQNGYVLNDGKVISSSEISGSQSVYWWRSGFTEVQTGTMTVDGNGFTSATFAGAVFTVYTNAESAYVYKAEIISYDSEGSVEISGSHVPVEPGTGKIAYLNLANNQFVVENEQ
jgi:hypothetical protein